MTASLPPSSPDILSLLWSPLCTVGSHGGGGPNAQICVSVFGASIVPDQPRVLVVLSNTNFTTGLVAESGSLAVTALSGGQIHLLEPLGLRSGRDGPKLQGLEVELTSAGDPWFPGGAGAMRCEVVESMDFGDSTGFLCAVRERWPGRDEAMRWADARAQVGAEFLAAWAEKSAREQATARQAMKWVD